MELMKKMGFVKNEKGLTLIELLAVVVILGIIAAIAVPAIGGTITKSQKNADVSSLIIIQDAVVRKAQTENIQTTPVANKITDLVSEGYLNTLAKSGKLQSDTDMTFDSYTLSFASNAYVVSVIGVDGATDEFYITETAIQSGTFTPVP